MLSSDLKVSQQCAQAYSEASKLLGVLLNRSIVYKSKDIRPVLSCPSSPGILYCLEHALCKRQGTFGTYSATFYSHDTWIKRITYPERLKSLNLWTLEERQIIADLIEVCKMLNGLSDAPFESIDTSTRTRGHSYNKLIKNRFNTDLRQHLFSERVINFWNTLEDSTVSAAALNSFKHRLTTNTATTGGSTLGQVVSEDPRGWTSWPVRPRPVNY